MRGGGGNRMLPKDQQDRMLFDSEASAFFQYLIEKLSLDKTKALIQFASEGNESYDWIVGKEAFGSSIDQIEEEWLAWLQEQKEDGRSGDRPPSASGRPENPSGASGE